MSTRSKSITVLGFPHKFSSKQLPTKRDVFLSLQFCKDIDYETGKNAVNETIEDLKNVFQAASIPIFQDKFLKQKIRRLINEANCLLKFPIRRRNSTLFNEKIKLFDLLFDISTCRCYDAYISRDECKCRVKIPLREYEFYVDQKTSRKLFIGAVDVEVTKKIQIREYRNEAKRMRESTKGSGNESELLSWDDIMTNETFECDSIIASEEGDDKLIAENDDDYYYAFEPFTNSHNNTYSYPNLIATTDRYGASDRLVASVVNAALADMGMLTPSVMLDHSKVWRERKRLGNLNQLNHNEIVGSKLTGLYFDGRKDETRILKEVVDENGKTQQYRHPGLEREEHVVLLKEPGGFYIDHVTPKSSKSVDTAEDILSVIRSCDSSKTLECVGCDGCNVNTGVNNGIIRTMELELKKPLQWFICLLHCNELPFRKLFETVDGTTSGPTSFNGILGKSICVSDSEFRKLPVAEYKCIGGNIKPPTESIMKDLSTDQKYLLNMALSIQYGSKYMNEIGVSKMLPGPVSHSRWLTVASRLLRIYTATKDPSRNLIRVVNYIMKVYVPSWFQIKSNPTCSSGSINFYGLMSRIRELPGEDQIPLRPVIQRNSFFAHCENVLLSAILHEDESFRQKAVRVILGIRCTYDEDFETYEQRKFVLKPINWEANTFFDMVNWNEGLITESPLLKKFTNEEIRMAEFKKLDVPLYPCHTQSVERAVKLVTAASNRVYGHEARHRQIVNTVRSREKIPKITTKRDFCVLME